MVYGNVNYDSRWIYYREKFPSIFNIGCKHGAYPLDVVVAAGEEESLGGVAAPPEEGRDRHAHAVGPQDKQDQERLVKSVI